MSDVDIKEVNITDENTNNVPEINPPSKFSEIFFPLLLVSIISVFPVLFLYLRNVSDAKFSEAVPLIFAFWGIGLLLLGIVAVVMRNLSKAAIFASIFMIIFQNYAALESGMQKIFKNINYIHVVPLFLFILAHAAYLIYKKLPSTLGFSIVQLLSIGFGAVIIVLFFTALPTLIANRGAKDIKNWDENIQDVSEKPNIYYLLFDEYSRFDMMEKYFDYDNSEFAEFLEKRNFNVSYTSDNECAGTMYIVSNLMMMDYVAFPDSPNTKELEEYRENGFLRYLLELKGYKTIGVGQTDYVGIESETYNEEMRSSTIGGETFSQLILEKTAIYPFIMQEYGDEKGVILLNARDYFISKKNYKEESNRFLMSYLVFPHEPFVFTADGKYNDPSNWSNWDDKSYYLGQYIYVTSVIEEMIDGILENDPNSIIILQSDHGARALIIDEETGDSIPEVDRRKILNAVYYCGEEFEIEGKTGVNTLRVLFSDLLEMDLPELEVPYFE